MDDTPTNPAAAEAAVEIPPYKQPGPTYSQRVRMQVDAIAADDREAPTLWETIRSQTDALVSSYTNSDVPLAAYAAHLHDLWYTCVQAARVTPAADPAMDRLALLVLAARERGVVARIVLPPSGSEGCHGERDGAGEEAEEEEEEVEGASVAVEHAVFPGASATGGIARLFTDLPFLVPDLLAVWRAILLPPSTPPSSSSPATTTTTTTATSTPTPTTPASIPAQHRCNLASFTARLVGLGACRAANGDDRLALAALWLLRAVAETRREDGDDGSDSERVAVREMLPAVLEWTRHAGHALLGMAVRGEGKDEAVADNDDDDDDDDDAELGELAREAGVGVGGWSLARWGFWKERFGEMKGRCEEMGDEEGAALARKCAASLRWREEGVGGRRKGRVAPLKVFFQVA